MTSIKQVGMENKYRSIAGLLRRVGPRWVIHSAIVALTLFVFALSTTAGWNAFLQYRDATRMLRANEMADRLIVASGVYAMERGLTSGALGTAAPADAATLREIAALRADADREWRAALTIAREYAAQLPAASAFAANLAQMQRAHTALEAMRGRVDVDLRGARRNITFDQWLGAITDFIAATARLRESFFLSASLPQDASRLDLALKHALWVISEHAGLERGTLAYYVGAGRPVPARQLDELKSFRGVVDNSLSGILALKVQPDTPPPVRAAITAMEERFITRYNSVRAEVYRAAARGDYSLSGHAWMERATDAIDSVLAVNTAVTREADAQAGAIARESLARLALHGALFVVAAALGLFSLTKVRRTANALFQQKELAEVTLSSIGDAVITTDAAGGVENLNPIAEEMTGWQSAEAHGRPLAEVFRIIDGHSRDPAVNPVEECLREGHVVGLANNTILVRRDGTELMIDDSAAPIRDREGRVVGAVLVFYDVAQQRNAPHLLSHQATHDALTGLYNRREFERRLAELVADAKNLKRQHVLCYIDLDQFKIVNDTCGHAVGDNLLRHLTYLLKQRVRGSDTLARLGGDEFGVLLASCQPDRALAIAEELRRVIIDSRFAWQGHNFVLGASIGIVPITSDSVSPAELLSEADSACYVAKEKGRNRVQVYTPGDVELARRHGEMQWVSRINEALAADRFVLYCQPVAPLNDSARRHCEILVRMLDEQGELVPPMAFIPAAERYNLMPAIDRWVIRNAFGILGRCEHNKHDSRCATYNINLSGASLSDDGLAEFVSAELAMSRVPADSVCFEITETAAIANLGQAMDFINGLKALGCRFALDDFGSGLSSFVYLKNLKVDFIKIDGSFVKDMVADPMDHAMVQSINNIGHVLGIQTIAEFVESEAIVERLRELGVDYAQGYAIARPGPLRDCAAWCAFGRPSDIKKT
jgi:diguanylate cyclase (GGDEF)-like protein/PAS domain S-box-containing protein